MYIIIHFRVHIFIIYNNPLNRIHIIINLHRTIGWIAGFYTCMYICIYITERVRSRRNCCVSNESYENQNLCWYLKSSGNVRQRCLRDSRRALRCREPSRCPPVVPNGFDLTRRRVFLSRPWMECLRTRSSGIWC